MKCPACEKRETSYRLILEKIQEKTLHAWRDWEELGLVEICEEWPAEGGHRTGDAGDSPACAMTCQTARTWKMAEANVDIELDPPVSARYEPWETRRHRIPEGTEVEPLRNDVLLEPLKQEGGRIIIPESAAADLPQALARVLAVGSGETRFDGGRVPLELQVGDIVVYVPGRAVPVKYGGRRVLLTTERHVLCVYHGDPAEFGEGPTGDIGAAVLPREQPSPTDVVPRPQPVPGRPKIVTP